jgi:uncharacterized membrane protein YbhN (UPF0104 family)
MEQNQESGLNDNTASAKASGRFIKDMELSDARFDKVTDKDRLLAAKQILLGLAIIVMAAFICYLIRPQQGEPLIEICKTSIPPLATLIIAFYFKEKGY